MDSDNQEIIYSEAVSFHICDKLIETNSVCNQLKALSYEEFDRYKHETLTTKNPDMNQIDIIIDTFINDYDKEL